MGLQGAGRFQDGDFALATAAPSGSMDEPGSGIDSFRPARRLIVIGFMGGRVHAGNLVHPEAQLIRNLQQGYPLTVEASIFANRHGDAALKRVLQLLDRDGNGRISQEERNSARIEFFRKMAAGDLAAFLSLGAS